MKLRVLLGALLAVIFMAAIPGAANAAEDDKQEARIHLLHGIPDTDVDVIVAGEVVIEGFAFGDTFDLSGFAGQTLEDLKVNVAGTETTAIDAGDTDLPASGNFSVVAHLNDAGEPALAVFENDTSKIKAGEGRLTVRHAAAAPLVDVLANGEVAFAEVANGEGGSADLAVGTISASVVPAGETDPVVIGPADFTVTEGESLIVYAVGSLEGESLTVLTETVKGIHSTPTAVHTGTSPVSNGTSPLLLVGLISAIVVVGGSSAIALRAVKA